MITPFKFFRETPRERISSGFFRFDNGDTLQLFNEDYLQGGINRMQYGDINLKTFRWVHNYYPERDYRENTMDYMGPINMFYDFYELRRNFPNRVTILPEIPVIQSIECNGQIIYGDSLVFSNFRTPVRISYKKYHEVV